MRSRHKLALLFSILLVAAASVGAYEAYNGLYNVIPESRDVWDLKVEELTGTGEAVLRISGFAGESAFVVRKVSASRNGNAITVLPHLALVGLAKSKTGTFQYQLTIPDSVNEVRFGRDAKLIWKRGSKPQR